MTSPEETLARLTRLVARDRRREVLALPLEPESRSLALTPPATDPGRSAPGRRLGLSERSLAWTATGPERPASSTTSSGSKAFARSVGSWASPERRLRAAEDGGRAVESSPSPTSPETSTPTTAWRWRASPTRRRSSSGTPDSTTSSRGATSASATRSATAITSSRTSTTSSDAAHGDPRLERDSRGGPPRPETMQTAMAQIRRSAQFLLTLISTSSTCRASRKGERGWSRKRPISRSSSATPSSPWR